MLHPVILSGGSGTRLWPLSRQAQPKQFFPLTSELSLFQQALARACALRDARPPIVVCNREHGDAIGEQLRAAAQQAAEILLEPMARNTGPALAAAALAVRERDAEALLLALPSDHLVRDPAKFVATVEAAMPAARAGRIVAFGVVPGWAETGYGYIRRGAPLAQPGGAYEIRAFVEKPDAARACEFVGCGEYYWNGGMFLFRARDLIEELGRLQPRLLEAARAALAAGAATAGVRLLEAGAFARCPSLSIDHAVMEHTTRGAVFELDAGWSDLGTWSALWQAGEKDADGNIVEGDVYAAHAQGCYLRSSRRMVAAVGVRDIVLVETADAVLVASKDASQRVREVVERLEADARPERVTHRRVARPWGHFESIEAGERFQVKRLTVRPGGKLSLQLHHHRSEHWVVVKGVAHVTRGSDRLELHENESVFIPQRMKHRLENAADAPLEVIEVQVGAYLGEDDIVRFVDAYQRV